MTGLEERLGHAFQDRELLRRALTHPSWCNEDRRCHHDNQRLEFLGDAVLELVVSDMLFRRFTEMTEGGLTRRRASLVCTETLARVARSLDVGPELRLGYGETQTGGADKDSILADAVEALIGAIYMDGGVAIAESCVLRWLEGEPAASHDSATRKDAKSRLQELSQSRFRVTPRYRILSETGPEHAKDFVALVEIPSVLEAEGHGRSKKEAERAAAEAGEAALSERDRERDQGLGGDEEAGGDEPT